jgi:RNA polymerase sigma-70 factor (ECF subfamily)
LAGDLTAFRSIFRAAVSEVHWLAYRIVGNKEAAEDVAQETFIKIYQMREQLDPERPLKFILLRIATNLAIDYVRKTKRENLVPIPDETDAVSAPVGILINPGEEALMRQIAVNEALGTLPVIYRSALVLKYAHDLSYEEIAQALGISTPAVALRIKRGKELLRQELN